MSMKLICVLVVKAEKRDTLDIKIRKNEKRNKQEVFIERNKISGRV